MSYQRRDASGSSAPIDFTVFPPKSCFAPAISTSGSSGSYPSGGPPRLELDFFTTSQSGVTEAEELGIPPHLLGPATSSRSRISGESNLGRFGSRQEATLSSHRNLNVVDDVVESGTLEGLVEYLVEHSGEQGH